MPNSILIVDDEFSVRMSLQNYFKDREFDVFVADSGEEALEILKQKKFDIVIADMRLPVMDGNSLILKANEICPSLKFIVYTGSTTFVLPSFLEDLGISNEDIFLKPLNDMNVIFEAVKRHIN